MYSNHAHSAEIQRARLLLMEKRGWREAERICRAVLRQKPNDSDALHVLGLALHAAGQLKEALAAMQQASMLVPDNALFHQNIGAVWGQLRQFQRAAAALSESIRLDPSSSVTYVMLASTLKEMGNLKGAENAARRALKLDPAAAPSHFALGSVMTGLGRYSEAIKSFEKALQIDPTFPEALRGMAEALEEIGNAAGALTCHRKAIAARSNDWRAHSTYLFTLHYDQRLKPLTIFAEHLAWAKRHAAPHYPITPKFANDRSPTRSLRIGFVSPHFCHHVVGRSLLLLLRHLDRSKFRVHCFSDTTRADDITRNIQSLSEAWHETAELDDDAMAELVQRCGIDLLVDLDGHAGGTRQLLFARKPAPVQVAHMGYPNTTALRTMDYRITDALSDPPGATDSHHTERLIRLPQCAWCYRPDEDDPPLKPVPPLTRGAIVFGSLNKLVKISNDCVATWSAILAAVPGSRLMLLANGKRTEHEHTLERFAHRSIAAERVEFAAKRPEAQYLRIYDNIDIALDPFPFNGDNTTCDALWCDVPVITLAGNSFISRRGVSHLSAVGLPQLISTTPDQYIAKAVGLALDITALQSIRLSLRQRMLDSPLCDAASFARHVEQAYRHMWQRWCEQQKKAAK